MWRLFYNIVIVPAMWSVFHILGLADKKAARALRGRVHLFDNIMSAVARLDPSRKRIWFHSSSMGEFEQAKPIIAELKKRNPSLCIVVSFFSPSGYDHAHSYKFADIVTYIPFDSLKNAQRFVTLIEPAAAIFMRYDVWPNHLWELQARKIPTFIANATIRENGGRSLPVIRQFHRMMYNMLDYILTVSSRDEETFRGMGLAHPFIGTMGDTRFDQVWVRSNESKQIFAQNIIAGKKILVIGSSWEEDEQVLLPAIGDLQREIPGFLVILVPHEPTQETLERLETDFNHITTHIRFSELSQYQGESVILIDSIGILMSLYRYGHVAYVGGSFRQGIHNVLEPAVYGIPVLFGPVHRNSQEAVSLVECGGAFVGNNATEFRNLIQQLLCNEPERLVAGKRGREFAMKNVGATKRFLEYFERELTHNRNTP